MFIVQFKDGSQVTGEQATWDDVKTDDTHITNLILTLPFRAARKHPETGEMTPLPARTFSLGRHNRYYAYKEAVSRYGSPGGEPDLTAEIIGGIDDVHGVVFEARITKDGFITCRSYSLDHLTVAPHAIRSGVPTKPVV